MGNIFKYPKGKSWYSVYDYTKSIYLTTSTMAERDLEQMRSCAR